VLRDDALSPLFQAVREATEEAILNSLLRATTVTGYQGHTQEAIPIDRVVEICRRHRVIAE
jgi:D-aminopeptidase